MSRLVRGLALVVCAAVVVSLLFVVADGREDSPAPGSAVRLSQPIKARTAALPRLSACSRFAAPNGSDSGSGELRNPFRSAQRLADALSAGETGCLRTGTYDTSREFVLAFQRSGSPGAEITIQSYPGERAHVVGSVHVPEGRSHVRLANLDIEGTGTMNTIKVYSADVTIEGNDITNRRRGRSCLLLGSNDAGPAVGTVVRRNVFHDCGATSNANQDHGIYAANVSGAEIVENVFHDSSGYAIQLYPNARDTFVAGNVIDGGGDSTRGGIVIGGDGNQASRGNAVVRNIVAYARTYNVSSVWEGSVGSANRVDENCVWGARNENIAPGMAGFSASGNVTADPRFVDRRRHDYRLASDSPCLALVDADLAARLTGAPDARDSGRPLILSARRGGGSLRRTVLVRARDKQSGVAFLQLATNRQRPGARRSLPRTARGRRIVRQRLRYTPSDRRLYVRAIDRAGNHSRWRRVTGT